MATARLFLLCALGLMLSSCASLRNQPSAYVPPPIDCAAFDPPKVATPTEPKPGERDVVLWQLYAYAWQSVAEHIMGQRVETAACLAGLRERGVIK